jgi:hypothetical protein
MFERICAMLESREPVVPGRSQHPIASDKINR